MPVVVVPLLELQIICVVSADGPASYLEIFICIQFENWFWLFSTNGPRQLFCMIAEVNQGPLSHNNIL